jgi:hypothetical protein
MASEWEPLVPKVPITLARHMSLSLASNWRLSLHKQVGDSEMPGRRDSG